MRATGEHGDCVDVGPGEVQPEIGNGVIELGGVLGSLVGVDQVLPPGDAVALEQGAHGLRSVEGGLLVVICIDRDPGDGGGSAPGVHAIGFQHALSELDEGLIERKTGVTGGLVAESLKLLREVGAGVGRRRRSRLGVRLRQCRGSQKGGEQGGGEERCEAHARDSVES